MIRRATLVVAITANALATGGASAQGAPAAELLGFFEASHTLAAVRANLPYSDVHIAIGLDQLGLMTRPELFPDDQCSLRRWAKVWETLAYMDLATTLADSGEHSGVVADLSSESLADAMVPCEYE